MTPSPLQWVTLLYGGVTPPAGFVEFRFLPSKGRAWMPYPTFEGHPEEFSAIPTKQNSYFGISLRRDQSDGTAENVHPTHLVWVDIDLKGTPWVHGQTDVQNMTPEDLRECAEVAFRHYLAAFLAAGLPPRAVVYTGHGLQAYWARRARSTAADTESFNRGLAAAFDSDPKTVDVARIFRLPGGLNLKNRQRPLPVEVWHQDPDAWVEETALEPYRKAEKVRKEAPTAVASERPQTAPREGESVIAQWNARNHISDVLTRYGYIREDSKTFTRPGEDASGRDVKLLENTRGVLCSYHHSSNDPLLDGPGDGHLREPFDLWCEFEHGGDFKAAVRAAAVELGIQRKPPTTGQGTIGKNAEGQAPRAPAAIAEGLPDKPSLAQFRDLVLASFMERGLLYRYHQIWRSWWRYEGGVYEEVPDEVMAQVVDLTLQDYGHTLKNAQVSEVTTKLARDPGIGSRDVDQGAWHLNTRNGVLDLESGELYEHTPEYFSIIQSAAAYRPEMVAHEWLGFLRQAVPSEGDRLLLQQFAGLCLTGDTSPQKALLLIGEGGTGKGTLTRVLGAVLGNLATSSAIENIKDGSFLVGTLVGKRMCVVSELPRSFDWLPFKRITGEDSISVDVKNKTPYTTKLDMKLVILSNVMPFLGDDTSNSSLMRRFLPVAFNIKPEKPDPHLEARLTHPDELPGVLNWMLDGLGMLRESGMRFPNSDAAALAREIVEESNRVVTFLREECSYVPDVTTSATDLYTAYRKWCGETGHKPLSSTSFAKQLLAAGKHFGKLIDRQRNRTGTFYTNVMTSTSPEGWEEEA